MSTYNDNLHSSIVASLQMQNVELERISSQQDAAMFTLFYAEGATVTAFQKLNDANTNVENSSTILTQAVACSSLSNNVLLSANQASNYINQSITNISISASNVQVASNAIVRLAGDMGNIFAIINAADFKESIYKLANTALFNLNTTAYCAEIASKIAMDASAATAEVTAAQVKSKAKNTNDLTTTLLNTCQANYNSVTSSLDACKSVYGNASAIEKKAEGAMEDLKTDFISTGQSLKNMNLNLNMGLNVAFSKPVKISETLQNDPFVLMANVSFLSLTDPFIDVPQDPRVSSAPIANPIKEYYLIAVKQNIKYTFSIENAQNLVFSSKSDINPDDISDKPTKANPVLNKFIKVDFKPVPEQKKIEQLVYFQRSTDSTEKLKQEVVSKKDVFNENLLAYDSDGDPIKWGNNYSFFVYAIYTDVHKRNLNSFDDFLSAPSRGFLPESKLRAASNLIVITSLVAGKKTTKLNFSVSQINVPAIDGLVTYRAMFLPYQKDVPDGLLTMEKLCNIEREVFGNELVNAVSSMKSGAVIPIYFNLNLAENIHADNYLTPELHHTTNKDGSITYDAIIHEDTTDVFGNLLIVGDMYVPVVLSFIDNAAYVNILSELNYIYKH